MQIPLRAYWQLLRDYLRPQWQRTAVLTLTLLLSITLQLVNPQIIGRFIDAATAGAPLPTLINAALLYLVLSFVIQGIGILNTYLSDHVAWTATNALRHDLLQHVLGLDATYHKQHTSGELLERIDGDVNELAGFFSRFTVFLTANFLLMLGILLLLTLEDWRVGLGWTLFAFVWLAIMIYLKRLAAPLWEKMQAQSAVYYGFLGEQLEATEDMRANGAVPYVLHRFAELTAVWFKIKLPANKVSSGTWLSNMALFGTANALTFGMAWLLWQEQVITLGGIYVLFYYTELLRNPLSQLRDQLENLQRAEASIYRINALRQVESRLADGQAEPLPAGALRLTIENLSFQYEDGEPDEWVLRDLNLTLEPGQVLGLLGRTGSGKTTLARLLLRLYDATNGRLLLNNHPLPTLTLSHLRQRVTLVTQDVQLFQATIRDNLTFFNPDISDTAVLAALRELELEGWLAEQPAGLDTMLGAGSAGLSAGQAQLLALTRVFLADPGLIILDEASSRLDPATEALLEKAIDKLLHNRTAIIIAHRLRTIARADQILILDKGTAVEQGDRQALQADPHSHFSQLLQAGLEEVLA